MEPKRLPLSCCKLAALHCATLSRQAWASRRNGWLPVLWAAGGLSARPAGSYQKSPRYPRYLWQRWLGPPSVSGATG